jgi:hypothetical protein
MWPDGEDTTGDSLKSTEKEWDGLRHSVTARGLKKGKELRVLSFSDTPFLTSPTPFPRLKRNSYLTAWEMDRWSDIKVNVQ